MTMTPLSFTILMLFCALLSVLDTHEQHLLDVILLKGKQPTEEERDWLISLFTQVNDKNPMFYRFEKVCWLEWHGQPVLFFYGVLSYTMPGCRFSQHKKDCIRCLIARTDSENSLLRGDPRMFRKIAETNQATIFYIRRLSEFAKEIQG